MESSTRSGGQDFRLNFTCEFRNVACATSRCTSEQSSHASLHEHDVAACALACNWLKMLQRISVSRSSSVGSMHTVSASFGKFTNLRALVSTVQAVRE